MNTTPGMYQTKRQLMRGMGWIALCAVAELAIVFGLIAAVVEVIKAVS